MDKIFCTWRLHGNTQLKFIESKLFIHTLYEQFFRSSTSARMKLYLVYGTNGYECAYEYEYNT